MDIVGTLREALETSIREVAATPIFTQPERYSSPAAILAVARGYEEYTQPFSTWLANVIAQVEVEEARVPLVRNLWEEHGQGNSALGHRSLMRSFVQSIEDVMGLDPRNTSECDEGVALISTADACSRLFDATSRHGALHGVGALLALELTNVGQVEALRRGVFCALPPGVDFRYLNEHEGCDDEHAAEIGEVASTLIETGRGGIQLIVEGAKSAVAADLQFWTGLAGAVSERVVDLRGTRRTLSLRG